ncbi:MAG TPA: N-acetyltransferase [Myxococcaceae bacterium]|nr:N-acetyltransferase [Myxococcaceae bacterium]
MSGIAIRRERPGDEPAVHRVNESAFGGPDEAAIVNALRANGGMTLSLVAELGGTVVGHILFSPVTIEPAGTAIGLAPMAVLPGHQRRGVGGRLVREGLELLRAAGHRAVVVLGHPEYYPRFGFIRASRFGLRCEFECPDEAFMAIELSPGALANRDGLVRYRREFHLA